jgi:hypothetical protein
MHVGDTRARTIKIIFTAWLPDVPAQLHRAAADFGDDFYRVNSVPSVRRRHVRREQSGLFWFWVPRKRMSFRARATDLPAPADFTQILAYLVTAP